MADNQPKSSFGNAQQSTQQRQTQSTGQPATNSRSMFGNVGPTATYSKERAYPTAALKAMRGIAGANPVEEIGEVHVALLTTRTDMCSGLILFTDNSGTLEFSCLLFSDLSEEVRPEIFRDDHRSAERLRFSSAYDDVELHWMCLEIAASYAIEIGMSLNPIPNDRKVSPVGWVNCVTTTGDLPYSDEDALVQSLKPYFDSLSKALVAKRLVAEGISMFGTTMDEIKANGCRLNIKSMVAPGALATNVFGDPVATDLTTTVAVVTDRPINNNGSLHNTDVHEVIASVKSTVDISWVQVDPIPQQQQWGQQVPPPEKNYLAFLVVTDTSPLGASSRANDGPLTFILGLAAATTGFDWRSVYIPQTGDAGGKPSIGVLGYEGSPFGVNGEPTTGKLQLSDVDVNGMALNKDEITPIDVLNAMVRPDVVVAVDARSCGPTSWIVTMLLGANPGTLERKVLMNELTTFFGVDFSTYLPDHEPFMLPQSHSVLFGNYRHNATTRSITEVGYLDVLDLSNGSYQSVDAYAKAHDVNNPSNTVIENEWMQVMKSLVASVTLNGRGGRYFPNPVMINAVNTAIAASQVTVSIEGDNTVTNGNVRNTALGAAAHGVALHSISPTSSWTRGGGPVGNIAGGHNGIYS